MYLRRYGGTLTAAAGSIQVPICIFLSRGVCECGWVAAGHFFGRLGKQNSLLLQGLKHLGVVALCLGGLVESWMVEMCIRTCFSSHLLHSIITRLLKRAALNVVVTAASSRDAFVSICTQLRQPR